MHIGDFSTTEAFLTYYRVKLSAILKMMKLNENIETIPGIGPKYKILLNQANIYTVKDLLLTLPYKYSTFDVKTIAELTPGDNVFIKGKFSSIKNLYGIKSRFKITRGVFEDETGKLETIWFNMPYIANSIPLNFDGYISAKVDTNPKSPRKLQAVNPIWFNREEEIEDSSTIIPIYSQTQGISSRWISKKIEHLLSESNFEDHIDKEFLELFNLTEFDTALKTIHQPKNLEDKNKGLERIAFEELLTLHLQGLKTRKDWEEKTKGIRINFDEIKLKEFIEKLSFGLTNDQKNAIDEIINDLKAKIPMNRLLQGDVGTGKTIVAFIAAHATALEGHHSILIAPTQILAQQHYENALKLLNEHDIKLVTAEERNTPLDLNAEKPAIIIGTHAILHRLDQIPNAGLIVIDEQHKFGVAQRSEIIDHFTKKQNGLTPNLLTMTATPIPRSLALAFYGDLSLSLINEYPRHRKQIQTWLINDSKRNASYDWIKKEIKEKGTQVFILCPFIEESSHEMFSEVKAAETEYENIKSYFNEFKVGLMHGRMKSQEKEEILNKFLNKEFDILVTTPVIEVGIDIPNANIIIIENPERMGLASLHQLRGRVGRGKDQGYCILISNSQDASGRLQNLETIHNGNQLAEIDLKLRGAGDIYGTQQHGFMQLKVADLTDISLVKRTKEAALHVFEKIDNYPKLKNIVNTLKYIGDD
jgi:ATP-dependent DNA helicase RecG